MEKYNPPLVVIITRITDLDEWTDTWNFKKEEKIAFVKGYSDIKVFEKEENALGGIEKYIKSCDAWVLQGDDFWSEICPKFIGRIPWNKYSRNIKVHIHTGDRKPLGIFREEKEDGLKGAQNDIKENVNNFFGGKLRKSSAEEYSFGGTRPPKGEQYIADFAYALHGEPEEYEEALRELRLVGAQVHNGGTNRRKAFSVEEPNDPPKTEIQVKTGDQSSSESSTEETGSRPPGNRLSMLKHRLSHLFIPLAVDLQGWKESGFSEEYAEEIAEAYSEVRVHEMFQESRRILCDIGRVVDDAKAAIEEDTEIEAKLQDVLKKLPGESRRTLKLVTQLDEKEKRDLLQEDLLTANSFRNWFSDLEEELEELRKLLPSK